jgi:hypothetical protein
VLAVHGGGLSVVLDEFVYVFKNSAGNLNGM